MPNVLLSSLALLDDVGIELGLKNVYWEWMIFQPITVLLADSIYCPLAVVDKTPQFDADVGFQKSNEVLNSSLSNAWLSLVREGVIKATPIDDSIREATRFAFYSVRNRLSQTANGGMAHFALPVTAEMDPNIPTNQLKIGSNNFCINHLDSVAAHLVVANATQSTWMGYAKEDHAVRWLYCGGLEPEQLKSRATKAVFDKTDLLRLPKFEFIPTVRGCGTCNDKGAKCFPNDAAAGKWISESNDRLEQLLAFRDTPEVTSLRRLLTDVSNKLRSTTDDDMALFHLAEKELSNSASIAEKRITKDLERVDKYCQLAALFSIPMAMFRVQSGISILGDISCVLAGGSQVISASAKLLLTEQNRWLMLRETDIAAR